jgi:hypothetical protein
MPAPGGLLMEESVQELDHHQMLRERLGLDERRRTTTERVFVWHLRLAELSLPGLATVRVADVIADGDDRLTTSVWVSDSAGEEKDAQDETAILVDVWECRSGSAAQDRLTDLLAQFQSLEISRWDGLGELAAGWAEGALVFLRGNTASRVLAGGPRAELVRQTADALDESLALPPDLDRTVLRPNLDVGAADNGKENGLGRTLRIVATDPQERQLVIKIHTRTGEIRRVGEELTFVPDRPGRHEIDVYAVAADGDAAHERLELETETAER